MKRWLGWLALLVVGVVVIVLFRQPSQPAGQNTQPSESSNSSVITPSASTLPSASPGGQTATDQSRQGPSDEAIQRYVDAVYSMDPSLTIADRVDELTGLVTDEYLRVLKRDFEAAASGPIQPTHVAKAIVMNVANGGEGDSAITVVSFVYQDYDIGGTPSGLPVRMPERKLTWYQVPDGWVVSDDVPNF